MLRRTLSLLALVAAAAPLAGRADDWDREWEEDYTEQQQQPYAGGQQPGDYDVSVDMNAGAVTFDTFQGPLAPYGDWVVAGGYGRVWRPHVAAGWRPYYYGRWEWTSEGWLWVSDEPFGWAAYHYGRWTYDSYYGWLWVPGYQWAPAWVAWRYSGDVVGWAPLGPGVSVYVSSYPFVDMWWTFVPCGSFVSVPVYSVAYAPTYTRRYFYATAPAPPVARGVRPAPGRPAVASPAWGGPAPRVIEQRIGRAVTPVRVVPAPAPGAARVARPGEISIYRPEARPAPSRSDAARGPRAAPGSERGALGPGEGRGAVGAPPARGGERAVPAPQQPSRAAPQQQPYRGAPQQQPSRAAPQQQPYRGAPAAPPPQEEPSRAAPPAPQAPARGGSRPAPGDRSGWAPQPGGDRGLARAGGRNVQGGSWRGDAGPARQAARAAPGPGATGGPRGYAAIPRGFQGGAPAVRAPAQQGRAAPLARGEARGRPGRGERDAR
jgi:hypothetical protein